MAGARVLLVDEDDAVLRPTVELLEEAGYQCHCARDGQTALERLKREHYDALITEIQIPGNERLELVRDLQRYAAGPPVPVILMTGCPSVETAIDALGLQVVAYLLKPLEPAVLKEKTKQAVGLSRIQRDIQNVREGFVGPQGGEPAPTAPELEPSPVGAFVNRTLGNISASLADLGRLSETLVGEKPLDPQTCFVTNCERGISLLEAVDETITVLEQARDASASPELETLREKLEKVRQDSSRVPRPDGP